MTEEPIAVVLCRATGVWPAGPATDYNDFIDTMLAAFDDLSQNHWNMVPADAREWAQQAISAKLDGKPLDECPGFETVFNVEDHTPMFPPDEEEDNEDDDVDEDDEEEVTPVKTKTKRGVKKTAAPKKKAAATEKKPRKPREARPLGNGKTTRIMNYVLDHPQATVVQIIEALNHEGMACTKPSTTVVRSFFVHAKKVLEARGMLK